MLKLHKFHGMADVLGAPRGVEFDGEKLTIAAKSVDEAHAILNALNGGAVEPKTALNVNASTQPKVETKPATKPEGAKEEAPKRKKQPESKHAAKEPEPDEDDEEEAPVKTKAKTSAKAELDMAGPDDDDDDEPSDEDDTPFSLDGPLPKELVAMGRTKEIVGFLQDRGFHTRASIIMACEKIKDRVPLLAKMPNVTERVGIALDAFHVE